MNIQKQTARSRRLGVIFFTRDDKGRLTAHLKRRRLSKDEGASNKWCGLDLPTLGIRRLPNESDQQTLLRLFRETIGQRCGDLCIYAFYEQIIENGPDGNLLFADDLTRLYGLVVHKDALQWANPEREADAFTQVTADDLSRLVEASDEFRHHQPDGKNIMVFGHTMKVLQKLLPTGSRRHAPARVASTSSGALV